MVEWSGVFRLLRFSRILGKPREVQPTFLDESRGRQMSNLKKKTDKNSVIAISIVYFLQAHFFIVEISRTTTIHPIVFIPQKRPR